MPISGSTLGKKILLKTNAAAVPYIKKSYHSMAELKVLDITILRNGIRCFPGEVAPVIFPSFGQKVAREAEV
ncbi:hypothetical protein AS032_27025 [Rhodococcus qingshengii]|nr:hypothetical protein AOT96_31835 [Rhodococcus sp. 008]KSU70600.1 hypothetical protein AS032_27025 [Rhodococcus qingshengii]